MDAKLTPEQAILEAQFIRNAFIDQPDMVLFSREYMFQIASLIESQTREAELGREVITMLDNLPPCKGKYQSEPCVYIREIHPNPGCHLEKVCRLRAEIDRLRRKGAGAGE